MPGALAIVARELQQAPSLRPPVRTGGRAYGCHMEGQKDGAPGPTRTGTPLLETDFESVASTGSATGASPARREKRPVAGRKRGSIYESGARSTMSGNLWIDFGGEGSRRLRLPYRRRTITSTLRHVGVARMHPARRVKAGRCRFRLPADVRSGLRQPGQHRRIGVTCGSI